MLNSGVLEQLMLVEGLTKMKDTVTWVKLKAVGTLKFPIRVPFIPEDSVAKVAVTVPEFLNCKYIVGIVSIRFQTSLYYLGKLITNPIWDKLLTLMISPVTVDNVKV